MGFWDLGAGDILGAAVGLAGGFMGKSSADRAAEQNAEIAREQMAQQREFAQHGIRWRVSDAQAAGIHPLYAMGAQLPSFTPVGHHVEPDFSMANAVSSMGQDIGRAVDATRTKSEKISARLTALQLERAELENAHIRAQIAKLTQTGPALPTSRQAWLIDGQGDGQGLINIKPMERTDTAPGRPSSEPGAIPDFGFVRTPTGWAPVPSKDAKERIEDNFIPESLWSLRNLLLPEGAGGSNNRPPQSALPDWATHWRWNPSKFEWQAVPRRSVSGPIDWSKGGGDLK